MGKREGGGCSLQSHHQGFLLTWKAQWEPHWALSPQVHVVCSQHLQLAVFWDEAMEMQQNLQNHQKCVYSSIQKWRPIWSCGLKPRKWIKCCQTHGVRIKIMIYYEQIMWSITKGKKKTMVQYYIILEGYVPVTMEIVLSIFD